MGLEIAPEHVEHGQVRRDHGNHADGDRHHRQRQPLIHIQRQGRQQRGLGLTEQDLMAYALVLGRESEPGA